MAQDPKHLTQESDIGSGEKSAGQKDVEQDVKSVAKAQANEQAPQPATDGQDGGGRILQSGTHLARVRAVPQPDGSFEAQVYVRLTREPEIAETYIPAGIFTSESDAWAAAEQRAKRALQEHEF